MKKVLVITYYWPPSGGAGVQRWLKFAKYLPELGWEPVILTVDPVYATYPAIDESLVNEVPEGMRIFKTRATDWFRIYSNDKSKVPAAGFAVNADNTLKGKISRFIRGNFFIPDPRRGWNRHAIRKATGIIKDLDIRHVITTSPPHSTQLIGLKIKKRLPHIMWIADLRDSWTDIYYYRQFYPTCIARSIDASYERRVLSVADKIITVGENLAEAFSTRMPGVAEKVFVIQNGYDTDDFINIEPALPARFTVTYIGTIAESYPIDSLLSALVEIAADGHEFLLQFAGNVQASLKEKIMARLGSNMASFIPYTNHKEAIRLMASSSVLLLIIPETADSRNITTGKIFEYIAAGKPVLYIGPEDGDATRYISGDQNNGIFDGNSPGPIKEYLLKGIKGGLERSGQSPDAYSRRNLAQKLSGLLKSL